MRSLSVIVITKNEEDRIERCLASVKTIADEIIVYDSGSTDRTMEIVQKYTEYAYVASWDGYGVQKQRALDKATCDWVLSIDADEEVDAELAAEIKNILNQSSIKQNAFKMRWKNIVFGKPTRFGRTARAPLRLFKREGARFDEAIVHEKVLYDGEAGFIKKGFLNHYSIRSFEHLLYKNRLYAVLMAEKKYSKGKKSYGIPLAVIRGLITFIQIYIFRLGILDGSRGLIYAVIYAQYTFNKYAGLWALEQQKPDRQKPVSD
ncbi:glycosyltransferase family 2 protein [Alteromonas sp. K632G]|jgi:glycosyltransferase involved in cell wall biosynthesis|uniref:glycosyltransferase family 2 protein n=1 Tax=Alteromonas sp. K632G TaxID=2820757 RepID=UPI001AD7DC25|nr:glycosyltransferase family 2 protein [Alteromonas sp. K632G]MBO7924626.1 glycosyltransferase family 2 protein [Alteromonas sp. K632G]